MTILMMLPPVNADNRCSKTSQQLRAASRRLRVLSTALPAPQAELPGDIMQITTTRFGNVEVQDNDVLRFPMGLIGFESECQWVLLADANNDSLGWLQSIQNADVAVPVVSPRRFAPDYRVNVNRAQIDPLELDDMDQAFVLVVLAKNDGALTMNLKAPLIVNLNQQIGRQVVTSDDQPLQVKLASISEPLRKSA